MAWNIARCQRHAFHQWWSLNIIQALGPRLLVTLLTIYLSMVTLRQSINSTFINRIITEFRTRGEMFHCNLCSSDYISGISFRYFYNTLRTTMTNWNLPSKEKEGGEIEEQCPLSMVTEAVYSRKKISRAYMYHLPKMPP